MEKKFSYGVKIPHKIKNCIKCTEECFCDGHDKFLIQNQEFSANLNEVKRQAPDEFGHMLPKYITT